MAEEEVFTQEDYTDLIHSLDKIIIDLKVRFGKTEHEVQNWFQSFLQNHYFPVWRAMNE
jgi:hypothetical protein